MSSFTPPPRCRLLKAKIARLRVVVDRTTTEVNDYTVQYEERRKVVEALGATQSAPKNKRALDVLELRERRLDAARLRKFVAISNLSNRCIADNNALQEQAVAAASAIAPSTFVATTTSVPSASTFISDKKRL